MNILFILIIRKRRENNSLIGTGKGQNEWKQCLKEKRNNCFIIFQLQKDIKIFICFMLAIFSLVIQGLPCSCSILSTANLSIFIIISFLRCKWAPGRPSTIHSYTLYFLLSLPGMLYVWSWASHFCLLHNEGDSLVSMIPFL